LLECPRPIHKTLIDFL